MIHYNNLEKAHPEKQFITKQNFYSKQNFLSKYKIEDQLHEKLTNEVEIKGMIGTLNLLYKMPHLSQDRLSLLIYTYSYISQRAADIN